METPKTHKKEIIPSAFEIVHSPEFVKWFEGSVVVDEKGQPKILYHGSKTTERFLKFNTVHDDTISMKSSPHFKIKNFVSKGVFFTGNAKYIKELLGEGRQLYRVYLAIRNPYITQENITTDRLSLGFVKDLQNKGFDGIKTTESGETYVVFEPDQIFILPDLEKELSLARR